MILLCINTAYKHFLGGIRDWENLQIGQDEDDLWIRGFAEEQVEQIEVKSIPHIKLFHQQDQLLFPFGSQLPARKVPNLLWSPIDRGLPVSIPEFNHNFFGIKEEVTIRLVPVEAEATASGLLVEYSDLVKWISSISTARLGRLEWVLVNNKALILGLPLLPMKGVAYWKIGSSLLPAGYDFEYPLLSDSIFDKLSPAGDSWIFWENDSTYLRIPKEDFRPLTRSSVRLSKSITYSN